MNRDARTKKLIILGVDGMDPATTKRLVDAGRLPHIKNYIERGAARKELNMLGAHPTITPPCWTTLATGAYPGTHGITCYWRQSPESLDAVVYNMDSRNCKAEQLWNVTAEAGLKTMVWHWPGSSWPPTSKSPQLHVVDGTQPGSVNMGVAQMDWEKIVYASSDTEKLRFIPHTQKAAGVGCNITDIGEVLSSGGDDDADEMMELWWGDEARKGGEIRTYVNTLDDTEMMIGAKVAYDMVFSPIAPARDWAGSPDGALEFTLLISNGKENRYGLITKNRDGVYDSVSLYRAKADKEPFAVLENGKMVSGIIDSATKKGATKPCCRSYKLLELSPDGTSLRLWISNALDTTNNMLWHPVSLHGKITENVGPIPPVSLIGGEDSELVEQVFEPSWDIYCKWQADCLEYLLDRGGYDVVFSHLHNVDCAGHQIWHLGKTLEPWNHTDEKVYQALIDRFYEQTDRYLGRFLRYLDEEYTILIVSDHGLLVGENVPPILGEYAGANIKVMEELGYTVLKKDASGNSLSEIDWDKTRAVQIRSNYIYLNLKGRDKQGIVDPKDKYALEEQLISDLYNYRDDRTGKRVVGIALRNKDAVLLGVSGPECGDIFFTVDEGFNRLHGDGLTTAEGYYNTSVSPVFIAAGQGIKPGFTTERVIRQVDVTPTAAVLLGTRIPAQCEGAPIYQILSDAL
ncbi:Type I phosphodiesterase / nucleotide pyrophosphatase [Sporobacter termitidis DSM 10068]|uniref:Type I phosphodiesterase / nucleotide pyrophosphatase n=1 Tax=Sporobacter termitidis DSM 10068 TaxID=1123282 RepID=A0A1M5UTF9_9FIRM|nr:alkaline phosphatase family protein [Sporobacter termitidis]SHH66322.1 Type I phosphodiesterase / nucleotide pyrophosphatase [Sporobacter termitidis DSM 10068]